MSHVRLRKYNARDAFPEQNLDNDFCQVVIAGNTVYLRGGPRIVDAGSYFLEARALSEGLLSFPLPAPETSVLGRFLVRSEHAGGAHGAVIFPPGLALSALRMASTWSAAMRTPRL